jgi:nitrogen-specific signal transduction histidine kinase
LSNRRKLEEQLLQKQSLESIGRLAGGVAHDFNNLLTAISGSAELAQSTCEDLPKTTERQEIDELLGEVLEASGRASELTSQLLGFARKRVIQPRVIELNEVVQRAERMLRRLIGEDVVLRTKLAPELWKVCVDPGQFEQILMNLAINARDAMPEGGHLLIETGNVSLSPAHRHGTVAPAEHVLLAVSDTGCGIAKEILPHIFEPFFTTKDRGRGTGLGLATCYGIVAQAGGHIYAYSEVDKGTTFKIYLPPTDRATQPLESDRIGREPEGSETLLLVEDDVRVRQMAARGLSRFGYRVLTASTAREALGVAEACSNQIALMITDVIMPEMSGRQLAERVGKLYPTMRVLFVSGYTENSVVHHGVLEPGIHFLPKPFTTRLLAQKVRNLLEMP